MASGVHKVDISWDRRPGGTVANVVFDNARRLNVLNPPALLDLTEAFLAAMKQGNVQWNPPVLNVTEARDDIGVVLVTAIEGGDIKAAATKANGQLQALIDATPVLK